MNNVCVCLQKPQDFTRRVLLRFGLCVLTVLLKKSFMSLFEEAAGCEHHSGGVLLPPGTHVSSWSAGA